MHAVRRSLVLVLAVVASLLASLLPGLTGAAVSAPKPAGTADDAPIKLHQKGEAGGEEEEQGFDKLRDAYFWSRLLSGDKPLTVSQAAHYRLRASRWSSRLKVTAAQGAARGGTWVNQGPDPLVQVERTSNTFAAMAGRIGALAIRNNGTIILGAAQGGVWTYNSHDGVNGTWIPRTKNTDTQSVGALALAPSNNRIVYMGSGEASLAGDSYYGDGIYRSRDGGKTWEHISDEFTGQSVSDIVVDPHDPNRLYISTVRGRGGSHRTSAPTDVRYGVWGSRDGGVSWKLLKGTRSELHGATDLVMDPQHPRVLWASFWGQGIFRSANAGKTWTSVMGDLPKGRYFLGGTRFSLGLSHPADRKGAVVYTGFDYFDRKSNYHESQIWKTTNNGKHWALATGSPDSGPDSVVGYCGTQCFYDNEVKPDPTNPNIVYALGCYGYDNSPQSGGIYRSTDGGKTWKSLGYDLHPDFHAIAFQGNNTSHIAIGNDGGVWQSFHRGGRNADGAPLAAADWQDLNGQVDPNTAQLIHSTNLAIGQFTSIQSVPQVPGQYWGGTQDNGTLRKAASNDRWFDQSSGDGGQVIVDQSTQNPYTSALPAYVFGEYYGISPYRFSPDKVGYIFGNETIDGGINLKDRSEFYVPMAQNRGNTNQMFLGTYRLYRSDNAEAPSAGDVQWSPISGDLTSGCKGAAPNGARGCLISAIGLSDAGTGVYVGTDEGWMQVSSDAVDSANPSWHRVGVKALPDRPVNQIAVDRSNWRIAYAAYGGFAQATPGNSGHVFATSDGGKHWRNISANLPNVPVNTVVIDPSNAKTLYVGTDVGPFLTTNGGKSWTRLGQDMPKVAIWQLDYDASHGVLVAGTHGRGAYTLHNRKPLPALVVSKTDTGAPVGPGSTIKYTITVKNIGNADATGVTVHDPLPKYTRSADIGNGGHFNNSGAVWTDQTVPAGGSLDLSFSVVIKRSIPATVKRIVNDGITVDSAQNVGTTGSPFVTPIAPKHGVTITPDPNVQGAKVGDQTQFVETLHNISYQPDSYTLSTSGGTWNSTIYAADCTTPLTTTPTVAAGDSTDVCVKTDVPGDAADDARDTATLTATSTGDNTASGTASLVSIAVVNSTLVVDEDGNAPDVQQYYTDALDANNEKYGLWDLAQDPNLPESYLDAHSKVVWFTGNSYPGPITPYERELKSFLDGGGSLFMSGQDILDQAAGTTSFVHDYLHINWDGSEAQNDKATANVTGVGTNPVTGSIGTVPLDHSVLNAAFEDEITPNGAAQAAFTDGNNKPDALTVDTGTYKVMFLAFPFEAYGQASDKATLMGDALTFFGP